MRLRTLFLAGALGAIAALSPSALRADESHLSDQTILVVSTGDWKALRAAVDASDVGRFLADPELVRIGANLRKGISGLMQKGMQEAAANAPEGTDPAAVQQQISGLFTLGESYFTALCEDASGRASFSLGTVMDPAMPTPMPNVLIEFGGTDRLHELHGKLLAAIIEMSKGEVQKAEFAAGGFAFQGAEKDGMGLYCGRKENRFLVGIHRGGITDYLQACEAGTERLGAQPFYKSAFTATGRGQLSAFVHLVPVWQMSMMMLAGMPVEEGQPNPAAVMQSLGITDLQGIASTSTWSPQGVSNRSFIGMVGRRGLLRLFPSENQAVAPPVFAPKEVLSANTFRLELSQVLNIVRDLIAIAPPEEKAEFEEGLAGAQQMLGCTVDELLGDLEGSVFHATPADAPAVNPMAMMMGGGAGLDLSFGLKLKSKERLEKLFATLVNPELTQGMVTEQEVSGRKVWAMTVPMGMAPMQFAIGFEGDWLVFGTGTESLRKCFARADAGESFAATPAYGALVERVGGNSGWMLGFSDTGKSLAQTATMLQQVVGMIPLFVPDVGQMPEVLFLFDPANIPSPATLMKYFGQTITRGRVADGGILVDGWSPTKSAPKAEETEKKPL